jgi:hypothetical protein
MDSKGQKPSRVALVFQLTGLLLYLTYIVVTPTIVFLDLATPLQLVTKVSLTTVILVWCFFTLGAGAFWFVGVMLDDTRLQRTETGESA